MPDSDLGGSTPLPLVHYRMADFMFGLQRPNGEDLNLLRPIRREAGVATYLIQHDGHTQLQLQLRVGRIPKGQPPFLTIRGEAVTLRRPATYVPTFVVSWRNMANRILLFVPQTSREWLPDFAFANRRENYSTVELAVPHKAPDPPPVFTGHRPQPLSPSGSPWH